jgi:uncharacterized protein YlzI (FlbEa/FlbD family)
MTMNMRQYTLPSGDPVTVNLITVAYVTSSTDGTTITFVGGASITVKEPYAEVVGTEDEAKVVGFGIAG